MTHTSLVGKFYSEFLKVQYLDHYSLIFLCHMFYFLEDYGIANYADDSTPYSAKNKS